MQQREEKVQDMELELASSPPPVEDVLAARRARRQAILAKYPDASSTADASGSSSAAQPPTKNSSFSDPLSQKHMVNVVGQSAPSKSPNLKEQRHDEELIR
jgi:serine/threonine-protein kinase PRP4